MDDRIDNPDGRFGGQWRPTAHLPDETVLIFGAPVAGMGAQVLAVSVPNALVAARDAEAIRALFVVRDAGVARGGPWRLTPVGSSAGRR